jgi:2-polyprenyl-3-methyl-5-hydroxy-6-metoxy-1,4-benzoquinol methylase
MNLKASYIRCPVCNCEEHSVVAKGLDFEYETFDEEFVFVECNSCKIQFLNPKPDICELKRIYPKNYEPYLFEHNKNFTYKVRAFLEIQQVKTFVQMLPTDAIILDAGCGGTSFLKKLQCFGSYDWQLWGNDFSSDVITDLINQGFNVLPGRFEEIDSKNNFFDAIFLKQVIEHIENPREVIFKTQKLLKQSGILVIETPNTESWDASIFRKRHWGGYHFPRHWTLFSTSSIMKLGEEAKLTVKDVKYMLSPAFWVQSVHHMFKDYNMPSLLYNFFAVNNPIAIGTAVCIDILQRIVSGKTSNVQIIFTNI